MSRISERISEILKYANSSRVTDKKKCVSELLDIYRNSDALKEICQNTERNVSGTANWLYIMHTVHKLAVDEAQRPGKETSAKINERQTINGLIINTIRHSNEKSTELLSSSEVISMILQILECQTFVHYHDTYLGILVQYILPKNTNRWKITAEQWKELLIVCIKLYKMHLKKHIVLDALQMIVEYSFSQANLLAEVKNLPIFLETVFKDVKKGKNEQLTESFYKLSNSVCRQLAAESRITLCKFSETVLMDVLRSSGSEEKYRLLLIFLQIHHPEGTSKCDDGAYAYDWTKWKTLLCSMCLLIQENYKLDTQWWGFVQFASEVMKQMLDNVGSFTCSPNMDNDSSHSQPTKRRRIISKMENIINLVTNSSPEEVWPLMKILMETLRKYPQCLRPQDFVPLLQHLTELAQPLSRMNESTEFIMDNIYRLAAILMKYEVTIEMQDTMMQWSKVWDILLRSLAANQNEESAHALVRCFVRYNRMPNANALLKLYLTKTIRWSLNSVQTLMQLRKYISSLEDKSTLVLEPSPSATPICDRSRLLEWLLNAPWQKLAARLPVDDLCVLSLEIILNCRNRQNNGTDLVLGLRYSRRHEEVHEVISVTRNIHSMNLSRSCFSSLAFKTPLLPDIKDKEEIERDLKLISDGCSVSYVQKALSSLEKQLCNIFQEENPNDEIYVVLMKLAFLARLLSGLKQLSILREDIASHLLIDIMKKHTMSSFSILANIDFNKCKYLYLLNISKALSVLYGGTYDTDIARIIISASTVNMLKNIFDLLNFDDNNVADYQHNYDYEEHSSYQERRKRSITYLETSSNSAREGVIRLQIIEALTSFSMLHTGENESMDYGENNEKLQAKIMKNLLTVQEDSTTNVDFRMSLTILESFARQDCDKIQREYADTPLKLLLNIWKKDCRDEESSRRLLNLASFFFEYATKYRYYPKRIVESLLALYKRIYKHNCGVLLHADYMGSICDVIRIDPDFSWSAGTSEEIESMLNSVLEYIVHPLFMLRIRVIRCLQELLSFRNVAYKWQEWIFIKVQENVFQLFNVNYQQVVDSNSQSSLKECQREDEKETRTATALIALTSVACASGVLQGPALCALLKLTVEKEVKVQKVQKVLLAVVQQTTYTSLVEDNLNYLLTSWIDMKYPLRRFPWMLLRCETANEFFRKYINYIIPLVLRTSNLNDVLSFCTSAGITFTDIFENVFPSCFAWLISRACDQSVMIDNVSNQTLQKLVRNRDEFSSTCSFVQLFNNQLKEVLVELIQRLHDEEYFERMFSLGFSISLPQIEPPHFSVATIARCFDYLELHFLKKPLTHVLVKERPAMLQSILLQLMNAIHLSWSREDKLKRLHQYGHFCSMLIRDLGNPSFDEIAAFFIRDVCYSLLHLTKSDEILSMASCKFLDLFLRQALPWRGAEMQDLLKFVVANLIDLAQIKSSSEIALNLLRFLIVEQQDILRNAIAKLSSFPHLVIFEEMREAHNAVRQRVIGDTMCLKDELESFLDAMSDENVECTLEDLANLTQQLLTRKTELKALHCKLEKSYPEETTLLHQVIFKLIKLTESSNSRISIEATRCLGELGAMDSIVALQPAGSLVWEANYAIEALTYRSVAMLTNFLVESAIDLRKVSADALYAVLSTTYGQKLLNPKYMKDWSSLLDKCLFLKVDYIRPFFNGRCVSEKTFSVDVARVQIFMNSENTLWTIKNGENYTKWITEITCSVTECFTDSYLKSFLPVCRLSIEFCELILPRIIYLIVRQCKSAISTMCDCINQFFRYHFAIEYEAESTILPSSFARGSCDRKIVRRMLDIVNHVRTQLPDGVTLKLDYIYLTRAAHECSAFYTALLFAQLACESFSMEYPDFNGDPKIDYIYERQPQFGRVLQDIMRDIYMNISDPDAIDGAGSSYLLDYTSRVQYYAHTNNWDKVMLSQDIELSHDNPLAAKEMMNALYHSGLQYLQWQFLSNNEILDEKFGYECAWRLSKWDLIINDVTNDNLVQPRLESLEDAFHRHHYHALKCLHENDQRGMQIAIECARGSVIHCLRLVSLESNRTINKKLSQLRLLREIEQLSSADSRQQYTEVLRCWGEHEILTDQFEYVEPILWQRIIMLRIKESLKANVNVQEAFFGTCLDLAMIAEDQGNFPVAARALSILAKHRNYLSQDLQNKLLYQESLLAWMKRDQIIARRLLRSLIEKKNSSTTLKAKALRVYGDWMAETKSENPQVVIQKYYLESIEISEAIDQRTSDVTKNLHDTQIALARFADVQYQQISAYTKSSTYECFKEYARTAVKVDTAQMIQNQDIKRAVIISQKQSTNDAAELESIEQEKRNYLIQALKYYLKILQSSEEHNLLIFRLVALWLDNMSDESLNDLLDQLNSVPSFKFVPLVPQLAAHITNEPKSSFSARIFEILTRCALEHPYHTLPVVLALKNLHSDNEYDSNTITKKEERRVLGAKRLLKRLTESSVGMIVHEMETLSRVLLSLAYWQPKGKAYPGKSYQISRCQPITKIRDLNNVLLPTLTLPIKPSRNYNNMVGVRAYQETCEFVGGVTAPKKVVCIGTDGVQRRQLVKGKDDLRQDAVMQQVFTVMNVLLRTCKETKKRNLCIRTYKVVPLTQRSGVLEWCDNAVPIAAILVGSVAKPGMHKKYYPRDMTAEVARDKLKNVAQESNKMKLKVFLECCKHMRPAFQHFFEEKYLSPETWVERTLTYTRSIATTSIAGYILGLGDRHLSNILVDERTAEVIHIDFGVAFEQGKVLPFPETIPFRLTRDIEVAMGASGIEGTMRRSCETTMTVLRDQRQIIITLLQVLLYDPLFTWAITPEKACKMQSDVVQGFSKSGRVPEETNKIAKRALLRVEQKLQGIEDGLVSSVSGQVERLLQEARDPVNLCRVYCGWQPYL